MQQVTTDKMTVTSCELTLDIKEKGTCGKINFVVYGFAVFVIIGWPQCIEYLHRTLDRYIACVS